MSETVTVLIATADRLDALRETLRSLAHQRAPSFSFKVIVADNSRDLVVKRSLQQTPPDMDLIYLRTAAGFRSKAVNAALQDVDTEFIAFTDDDVNLAPNWLESYVDLFRRHADVMVGCGPIFPRYPSACASWVRDTEFETILYAKFLPLLKAGPLPVGLLPLGPNFAARRRAIQGLRYREDLGPSPTNGPLSFDDLAFVSDLRALLSPSCLGGGFSFVPEAYVVHAVREEQMNTMWILDRMFNYGRSVVQFKRGPAHLRSPSSLIEVGNAKLLRRQQALELSFYLGQLQQLEKLSLVHHSNHLKRWLLELDVNVMSYRLGQLGVLARSRYLALAK